jgi:hypothetical protein
VIRLLGCTQISGYSGGGERQSERSDAGVAIVKSGSESSSETIRSKAKELVRA